MRGASTIVYALALGRACAAPTLQQPLQSLEHLVDVSVSNPEESNSRRKLQGRFLHITDLHPDPHYKIHSSTDKESACHRDSGPAGLYGAETSDCDSPVSLVNETFRWVEENLKDQIDFIIWTGDSARHDNDEEIPRSEKEVLELNELLVSKFVEVFGKDDNINDTDPTNDLTIPIVPTFGNNDILPHNILQPGPNRWTKHYTSIWNAFVPEEQRHVFARGGWFFVEAIPNKLAVFSLNTLYFFDSNSAVDGCAAKSEPGYEQMEWLRIQLQFLRQRGMKAILTGHVPPARTDSKTLWDETCWQKYTLWLRQYRDVVVGSVYGHMNYDHFLLQDSEDINLQALEGEEPNVRTAMDEDLSIQSAADYIMDLRNYWSRLPSPSPKSSRKALSTKDKDGEDSIGANKNNRKHKKKSGRKSKEQKFLKKIGGQWGERYSVSQVGASVVPNYFPSLRVVEYNITGLEDIAVTTGTGMNTWNPEVDLDVVKDDTPRSLDEDFAIGPRKKGKKSKKPSFVVPDPPSKSSPPGPAYSPQTLTFLGYTQYYANLTYINNDFDEDDIKDDKWREGKHFGKHPREKHRKPQPKKFEYQVEYSTFNDKVYKLRDLTVRSYLDLARRIGEYKPPKGDVLDSVDEEGREIDIHEHEDTSDDNADTEKNGKKHKKKKHRKHKNRKAINKVWFTFVQRAFVETVDDEKLHDTFGQVVDAEEA
ncbi:MAG: Endopolyphosphatase [Pycnora praestabilis]|nr:MAG: Endopolyphosphatase [Pycnora praestabilis]